MNWYRTSQNQQTQNDALRYLVTKYPDLRPLLANKTSKTAIMYLVEELAANPQIANFLVRQLQSVDIEQISDYDQQQQQGDPASQLASMDLRGDPKNPNVAARIAQAGQLAYNILGGVQINDVLAPVQGAPLYGSPDTHYIVQQINPDYSVMLLAYPSNRPMPSYLFGDIGGKLAVRWQKTQLPQQVPQQVPQQA